VTAVRAAAEFRSWWAREVAESRVGTSEFGGLKRTQTCAHGWTAALAPVRSLKGPSEVCCRAHRPQGRRASLDPGLLRPVCQRCAAEPLERAEIVEVRLPGNDGFRFAQESEGVEMCVEKFVNEIRDARRELRSRRGAA